MPYSHEDPLPQQAAAEQGTHQERTQQRYGFRRTFLTQCVSGGLKSIDKLAPELALQVTSRLFLSPPRAKPRASTTERLPKPEALSFGSGDRPLTAYRWGTGPVALFVHGWGGFGLQVSGLLEPLQAAGFSVVAPDLPAHGRSPGRTTNAFEFKRAIIDLVRHVGQPATVIAHSFGALATTLALQEGLSPKTLAFIAPMTSFNFALDSFAELLSLSPGLTRRTAQHFENRFNISRAGLELDQRAREQTLPLLVVHDHSDSVVPLRLGRSLARAWPNARLIETRDLGHKRILTDAAVIDSIVRFAADAA